MVHFRFRQFEHVTHVRIGCHETGLMEHLRVHRFCRGDSHGRGEDCHGTIVMAIIVMVSSVKAMIVMSTEYRGNDRHGIECQGNDRHGIECQDNDCHGKSWK